MQRFISVTWLNKSVLNAVFVQIDLAHHQISSYTLQMRNQFIRSDTMKAGLKMELDARKEQVSAAQKDLEVIFGKKLDTVDKDPALKEQVDSCLLKLEAAFTSLTGTMKSVKAAIEPYLNSICIVLTCSFMGPLVESYPDLCPCPCFAEEPPVSKKAKAKASPPAPAEVPKQ